MTQRGGGAGGGGGGSVVGCRIGCSGCGCGDNIYLSQKQTFC